MKFGVTVRAFSDKSGLELDAEYDRLEFAEEACDSRFNQVRKMPVSKEWAKTHSTLFSGRPWVTIDVDISKMIAADFEDWGTSGIALCDMEHERIDELLLTVCR